MDATERVMVIPRTAIEPHFILNSADGWHDAAEARVLLDQLGKRIPVEYRMRGEVEYDEKWLQIIPYVIVCWTKTNEFDSPQAELPLYLVYQRKRGDERLVGQWSIGFGGHIREELDADGELLQDTVEAQIVMAMHRELQEELALTGTGFTQQLKGMILTNRTPVDRVHLGLVFELSVFQPSFTPGPEVQLMGWYTKAGRQVEDWLLYEPWSRLCLKHVIGLEEV